ncbi:MAG: DUF4230 domain-containing protein [Candidatus Abyssubacteria bacterium]
MLPLLLSGIVGFALAVIAFLALRHRATMGKTHSPDIYSSMEKFRAVGELAVFKAIIKEVVTGSEHWFGDFGKKYMQWLVTEKKMILVVSFYADFRYDLRSPDFVIQQEGNKTYRLKMPKCFYQVYIDRIEIQKEETDKLLPWLLPGLISDIFGKMGSEEAKNRLLEEAKRQASLMTQKYMDKMMPEIHTSARRTLEALAKGFGVDSVIVDFTDSGFVQSGVVSALPEKAATAP